MKSTTKTTGKAPAKAAPKTQPQGGSQKKGLRSAQLRILAALAEAKGPMTRKEIAKAAAVDLCWLTEHIGSSDPEKRKANDAAKWPSLLSRGMVRAGKADGVAEYEVTAKGRQALQTQEGWDALKAAKAAKEGKKAK